MAVTTTTSNDGLYQHHTGTAQEVLDAIESNHPGPIVLGYHFDGVAHHALVRVTK